MSPFRFPDKDVHYTRTEQRIIEYIYQNPHLVLSGSIGQLAQNLSISEATVSRFARHAGYRDFKDLKNALANRMKPDTPADKISSTLSDSTSCEINTLLKRQFFCLEKTMENLSSQDVSRAVDAILQARHIYIHGKGASAGPAKLLHFRLNRFRREVFLMPTGGSELFESLVHASTGDLVILFGFQKVSREGQVIFKQQKQAGYTTLLFTGRLYDNDAMRADINLYTYRGEPEEYHSMCAPTALIDALVILVAARNREESVASLQELHTLKEAYLEDIPR